ncbi:unnamed protein product [Arabis nemorensis]|uniref:F-box domain-containing protein n=1 Tax=Arabis nemorensis TaxID=586526 RepID=A0A565C7W6_9BRAS|nr:unnamed protein product [Arabis nemorensis]
MSFPTESSDSDDSSSLSSALPLPNEISMNCFALVPRRYYPALSLVSKTIGGFITSPDLYLVRSLLQATENVLYVALRVRLQETHSWYSLNLKPLKDIKILPRPIRIMMFTFQIYL